MPKYYLKDKQRFAIPNVDILDNFITISDIEYNNIVIAINEGNRIECIDDHLVLIKNEEPDNSAIEYKFLRAQEYPPITDYLDAIVKGDQNQMQEYIDKCLAIKLKYPKPE